MRRPPCISAARLDGRGAMIDDDDAPPLPAGIVDVLPVLALIAGLLGLYVVAVEVVL